MGIAASRSNWKWIGDGVLPFLLSVPAQQSHKHFVLFQSHKQTSPSGSIIRKTPRFAARRRQKLSQLKILLKNLLHTVLKVTRFTREERDVGLLLENSGKVVAFYSETGQRRLASRLLGNLIHEFFDLAEILIIKIVEKIDELSTGSSRFLSYLV
ncbi:hypothetical protein RND71_004097 [Anisodus tanguticus]|uniref:Uncharacterized protein n=1 Tax=Anisodus tanguticus TaxID=243964 RepID=A0AAE1VUM0_9SOLA|nr:hypothetical protein RND71_004097 [Anisodus tanguticus]